MKGDFRYKLHQFRRKGGKKSRKAYSRRMVYFLQNVGVSSPHNIGKKHVHRFYERHAHFSETTMRDYYYAIKKLWLLAGRPGSPPKPPQKTPPNTGGN